MTRLAEFVARSLVSPDRKVSLIKDGKLLYLGPSLPVGPILDYASFERNSV